MKILLTGIICFLLGIGLFYGWTEYNKVKELNIKLQAQLTPTAISPIPTTENLIISPNLSPKMDEQHTNRGSVEGKIGYPSEGIPQLDIYAISTDDMSKYKSMTNGENKNSFIMDDLIPGTYYFMAYPSTGGSLAGGYSKAVPCGLTVECNDHSLIPVTITANQTNKEVQIKDWYAPEGTFPAKPN